jgi:GcrA cell cycle regulator
MPQRLLQFPTLVFGWGESVATRVTTRDFLVDKPQTRIDRNGLKVLTAFSVWVRIRGLHMVWTDEKVKMLMQLWETGQSITQIGKALGMTRNAVVGKAHRIGLAKRASPIVRSDKPAQPRVASPAPSHGHHHTPHAHRAPAAPAAQAEHAGSEGRSSNEHHHRSPGTEKPTQQLSAAMLAALTPSTGPRCKWPIGDPKSAEFDFCTKVGLPGKPYCAEHCAQAYTNWNAESAVEAVKAINAA